MMNLRIAIRSLRKTPGFALAFILTLGLGIGANTAIFSIINGVLLRPLPYPNAERLMHLRQPTVAAGIENVNFSFAEVADYRSQSKTIDEFVEFGDWTFSVLGRGEPHRATGGLVTPNFFKILGMKPVLGRLLVAEDLQRGASPVAVLTHGYWQRVFGSDPAVIGQTLDLTVKKPVIVGVLEPGSHYATARKQDFYVNYAANDHYSSSSMLDQRAHRMTDVYARLAPGATVASAQAELRQIATQLHAAYPDAYPKSRGFDIIVSSWKDELTAKAKPTLMILLGTTVFVLIIACANVANLTLTRLVLREREMAVRAALGAQRSAIRRELLAENLVLSVLGGVLGVALAIACLNLLISYAARFTTRTGEIGLDGWVLGFTLMISIGTALLFAWAPRLTFTVAPLASMNSGTRATGTIGRRRAQRALVISQLAVSFTLLIGAGLLVRSLMQLYAVKPGFDLANVLSLQAPTDLANTGFSPQIQARNMQFTRDMVEKVKGETTVQSAAMASAAPLAGSSPVRLEIAVDGKESDASTSAPTVVTRVVSAAYFETVGTKLKAGRTFKETDTLSAPPVVILSESMAKFYFKTDDPIGKRIRLKQTIPSGIANSRPVTGWGNPIEVVGIAADSRADGIDRTPMHTMYRPDSQGGAQSTLLVRTSGSTDKLAPRLIESIRAIDPNRPLDHVQTLEEIRDETIAPQRLNATLIALFSGLALAIATVGVAGVLSFSVSQRMNELGIRMALGAERKSILFMILGEGALMAAIGLALGGIAAIPLSRVISGLLFEVKPIDPLTIVFAAFLLIFVALAASMFPARRATAVDPMVALRRQ
jgi:putative ABC transport system permease protein